MFGGVVASDVSGVQTQKQHLDFQPRLVEISIVADTRRSLAESLCLGLQLRSKVLQELEILRKEADTLAPQFIDLSDNHPPPSFSHPQALYFVSQNLLTTETLGRSWPPARVDYYYYCLLALMVRGVLYTHVVFLSTGNQRIRLSRACLI